MRTILLKPHLAVVVVCWVFLAGTESLGGGLWAQQSPVESVEYLSADEYIEIRPTTCPLNLRGGLIGWLLGYPHAGHQWTSEWQRTEVLSALSDLAHYKPQAYDGYAAGKGDYIEAYYTGAARWYNPKIRVRCTATWRYYQGRVVDVRDRYRTEANFGTVEECASGWGGGSGGTQLIDDNGNVYDPYDPGSCSASGDPYGGGDSGGGDSGSGTQYGPGDSTGGETVDWGTGIGNGGPSACGATAVVEYICIDIMTESGWKEWDCGYVTSC